MTVHDAIRARKSVRTWASRQVDQETIDRVIEAARVAPSAKNVQEWRFVVVTDEASRVKLGEAANGQSFVAAAPVVVVACAQTDHRVMSCGHPAYLIDVAIAVDHLTLAAVEEGLGTCWIGAFDPAEVRTILGIPEDVEVIELLPLGYPADPEPTRKSRLAMSEVVHRERW